MEISGCGSGGNEPFALQVVGDSMVPEFADGQIVIVDPAFAVKSGAFVVVDFGGEIILGVYQRAEEQTRLTFLNPGYEALTLVPPYQIKGVVIQRAGRRRVERKHYY